MSISNLFSDNNYSLQSSSFTASNSILSHGDVKVQNGNYSHSIIQNPNSQTASVVFKNEGNGANAVAMSFNGSNLGLSINGDTSVNGHLKMWNESSNYSHTWEQQNDQSMILQFRNDGVAGAEPQTVLTFQGSSGDATFSGNVHAGNLTLGANAVGASHLPIAAGVVQWSGAGSSLDVSVPGMVANDVVSVTQSKLASEANATYSHVSVDTDVLTIHLDANNTTNDAEFHYVVYKGI